MLEQGNHDLQRDSSWVAEERAVPGTLRTGAARSVYEIKIA